MKAKLSFNVSDQFCNDYRTITDLALKTANAQVEMGIGSVWLCMSQPFHSGGERRSLDSLSCKLSQLLVSSSLKKVTIIILLATIRESQLCADTPYTHLT